MPGKSGVIGVTAGKKTSPGHDGWGFDKLSRTQESSYGLRHRRFPEIDKLISKRGKAIVARDDDGPFRYGKTTWVQKTGPWS